MVTRHFIVTLLIILVELRVAKFETVEIKLGNRNVIIPLRGPVHVKRIKPEELENLKINIPDLVDLVAKVQGRSPVSKAPQKPRLPSDHYLPPSQYQSLHPQPANRFFPEHQVQNYPGALSFPRHSQDPVVNRQFSKHSQQEYESAPEHYQNREYFHPDHNVQDEIQHSLPRTVETVNNKQKIYSQSNIEHVNSSVAHTVHSTEPYSETKDVNELYSHDKVITKPQTPIFHTPGKHVVTPKDTHDPSSHRDSVSSDKHHELLTPTISKWIHDHELLPHINAKKPDVIHVSRSLSTTSSPRLQHTQADAIHKAEKVILENLMLKDSPSKYRQQEINLHPKLLFTGSKYTKPLPTSNMNVASSSPESVPNTQSDTSSSSSISKRERDHTEPSLEKTTLNPVNLTELVISKVNMLQMTTSTTNTHNTYAYEIPDSSTPKLYKATNVEEINTYLSTNEPDVIMKHGKIETQTNTNNHNASFNTLISSNEVSENLMTTQTENPQQIISEVRASLKYDTATNAKDINYNSEKITASLNSGIIEEPITDVTPKTLSQQNPPDNNRKLYSDIITFPSAADVDSDTTVTIQRHATRTYNEDYGMDIATISSLFVTTTEAQENLKIIRTDATALLMNETPTNYPSDINAVESQEVPFSVPLESIATEPTTISGVSALENIATPIITSTTIPSTGYERITNATHILTFTPPDKINLTTTNVTTESYVTDSTTELPSSPFNKDDTLFDIKEASIHIHTMTNSGEELFITESNINAPLEHISLHDDKTEKENITVKTQPILFSDYGTTNDSDLNKPTKIETQNSTKDYPVENETKVNVQNVNTLISNVHPTQSASISGLTETTTPQIRSQEIANELILITTTDPTITQTTFIHKYGTEISLNTLSSSTYRADEGTTELDSQDLSTELITTLYVENDKSENQKIQSDMKYNELITNETIESYLPTSASNTYLSSFEDNPITNTEIVPIQDEFTPNVNSTENAGSPITTGLPEHITESSTAMKGTLSYPLETTNTNPVGTVMKRRCKHGKKKNRDSTAKPAANGKRRRRRRRRKRPTPVPSDILQTPAPL